MRNTWPWVASLYILVEAFRRFTRPGLTWAGLILLVASFWFPGITPEQWKGWQEDGGEPDASAPEAK